MFHTHKQSLHKIEMIFPCAWDKASRDMVYVMGGGEERGGAEPMQKVVEKGEAIVAAFKWGQMVCVFVCEDFQVAGGFYDIYI